VCKRYRILYRLKDTQDVNGLARMDNTIGQIKESQDDYRKIKGGDWLTHIEKATTAFNKTPHGVLDAAPEKLPPNVVLEQINKAAKGGRTIT